MRESQQKSLYSIGLNEADRDTLKSLGDKKVLHLTTRKVSRKMMLFEKQAMNSKHRISC
jgi:hypothetical protein